MRREEVGHFTQNNMEKSLFRAATRGTVRETERPSLMLFAGVHRGPRANNDRARSCPIALPFHEEYRCSLKDYHSPFVASNCS